MATATNDGSVQPAAPTDVVKERKAAFAVVQTGYITEQGEIVSFMDDSGSRLPQVLAVCPDVQSVKIALKRAKQRATKVSEFVGQNMAVSQPILGWQPVYAGSVAVRKPMTDEQRKAAAARLELARKRQKGK